MTRLKKCCAISRRRWKCVLDIGIRQNLYKEPALSGPARKWRVARNIAVSGGSPTRWILRVRRKRRRSLRSGTDKNSVADISGERLENYLAGARGGILLCVSGMLDQSASQHVVSLVVGGLPTPA